MDNDFLRSFSSRSKKYIKDVFESDCVYVKSLREWVGRQYFTKCKVKEETLGVTPKLLVNVAKSNASKCRICGFPIEKGTLRVGYPSKDPRGSHGYISCWIHLCCSKHLIFTVLYNEQYNNYLEKYLDSDKIILEGDKYNAYELNIYSRINFDLLFGGYSELEEKEQENVKNMMKPYEIDNIQIKNSMEAITNEEKEKINKRLKSFNVETVIRTDNFTVPEELNCELLRYQVEGVVWMINQENSSIKGGILADEMGMGKTIQAITLLICQKKLMLKQKQEEVEKKKKEPAEKSLSKMPSVIEILSNDEEENNGTEKTFKGKNRRKKKIKNELKQKKNISTSVTVKNEVNSNIKNEETSEHSIHVNGVPRIYSSVNMKREEINDDILLGGTLIVAPVAAVMQWKTEIEKYVEKDFLKTYIYHDSSRNISIKELVKYDVIITSYPTVEVRFRKILNKHKVSCEFCGRLFLPRTLIAHQKYFCGPLATRTEKLKKRKKKNKKAALVAIRKFDDTFVPTPRNVLMEIMTEATKENGEKITVVDVEKTYELVSDGNSAVNQRAHAQGKGKGTRIKRSNDKKETKLKVKNIGESKKEKDEDTVIVEEGENDSSDHSVFSPLSRKTSSRIIDLCNVGFDKDVIERHVDYLYQKQKKKKRNWNLIIKRILENDIEQLEMNGKCIEVLNKIYLSEHEITTEELKKLNMGELKVILIAMGKHVFGTKIELMNRIIVSVKYVRYELNLLEQKPGKGEALAKKKMDDESFSVHVKKEGGGKTGGCGMLDIKKEKEEESEEGENYYYAKNKKNTELNAKGLKRSESENSTLDEIKKKKMTKSNLKKGIAKTEKPLRRHTVHIHNKKNASGKRRRSFALDESEGTDDSDETFSESDLIGTKQKGMTRRKGNVSKKLKLEEEEEADDDDDDDYDYEEEKEEEEEEEEDDEYSEALDTDASYDSIYVRKTLSKKKNSRKDENEIDLAESALHKIKWTRIILDEAHRIKNRNASTTQSIFNLHCSGSRWCLTGTPLQNRIGELFSLIRFLKYFPYAYYFCSRPKCKCFCLNYSIKDNKYCTICKHSKLNHFNYFNRRILKPMQQFGYSGEGTNSMIYLKEEVLDKILLRRTKAERQSDVKLKPLIVTIRKDKLSDEEKDFYESLYKQTSTQFDTYVKANTVLHNYAHIFDLLSRLRQAADHPYLIIFGNSFLMDPSGKFIKKNSSIIPAISSSQVCGICLENVSKPLVVQTKCKHNFHKSCLKQYLESFDLNSFDIYENNAQEEDFMLKEKLQHFDSHNEIKEKEFVNSKIKNMNGNAVEVENGSFRKSATSHCVSSVSNLNKSETLIMDQAEELKHKAKTISNVKFKDKEKSEFISLLNNDENVKKYPAGCPICFVPLTFDYNVLYQMEGENDEINDEDEEIITTVKEEEKCKYVTKSIMNRINTEEFQTSTKIKAIFEEVQSVIKETDDKCLIFSQYCSMLDLIEYHLKKNNIICAKLLGYMSMKSRNNILYNFNKDKQLRVLLISLKAGGEGLNLQVANRIFIVDPWWNPAAELQAIQRAHRIGQLKVVYAIRFIIENTVEEKMIQLQKKKQLVFDCTIGGSNDAMQKLTKEDLSFLFQA